MVAFAYECPKIKKIPGFLDLLHIDPDRSGGKAGRPY